MRADPEKRAAYNEYMREWKAAHPGAGAERSREWRERNPNHRVALHGLTPTEFARMVDAQGGKCSICQQVPQGQRLRVDHDHACCDSKYSCGKCIRGLLCSQCNAALGGFRDDPKLLEAAMRYLTGVTDG